jgi:hypothetical protein
MKINEKYTVGVEELRTLMKLCKYKLVRVPSLDDTYVAVFNDDIERCLQVAKLDKTFEVLISGKNSIKTLHIIS